jgi:CHAT domain-containing protein
VPRPPGPLEGGDLAPLPSTASEAAAIRGLAPPGAVRLFLGFDASRTLVTSGALESFRTLHFATHGLFNEEQPESSAIVLSRFDREGRPIGGLLRAADIEKLRLRAELVVLSACQTALGRQTRGEGMVGLTQSFFAAGADRVLVSLWKVDDRATALLMASFYRKLLRNGRTPPAALREAQLAMWRQKRSPYQWAGFLLQGDWNWKDFPF